MSMKTEPLGTQIVRKKACGFFCFVGSERDVSGDNSLRLLAAQLQAGIWVWLAGLLVGLLAARVAGQGAFWHLRAARGTMGAAGKIKGIEQHNFSQKSPFGEPWEQ